MNDLTVYAHWKTDYQYIRNATDLRNIANNTSAKYMLIADIPNVGNWTPISSFSGELVGLGHTISGMTYSFYDGADVDWGMFTTLNSSAIIDGVNFRACTATYVAPGKGYAISEVHFGFVAAFNYGTIRNCEFTSNYITIDGNTKIVSQWAYAGVIVSDNYGSISNCYVAWCGIDLDSDTVDDETRDDKNAVAVAGGVCAQNLSGATVNNCTSEGNTIKTRVCYFDDEGETIDAAAGGLIGANSGAQSGNTSKGNNLTATKRYHYYSWGRKTKEVDGDTGSIYART